MFKFGRSKRAIIKTGGLVILLSVFLGACKGTPTEQSITEITWKWTSLEETEPAAQSVVPNPGQYTLLLQPDGSINLQVDCNMASGEYSLDGEALTIEVGPSTMAFCGEESLDLLYLELLSKVERYEPGDGQLILLLADGTGRMTFGEK